ncbi:HAD family hydrolase [Desulfolucanica intricata]|uniref:HAD family hydrolase n=1 Tax=Desulfolucanica intricata TaxID=1285191 RepID=UPI0008343955|nr:HAD family hydrolase [Desulfolucanica intricata]
MFKAILFDLDGTLLPMDLDEFVRHYFSLLTEKLAYLINPELMYQSILTATKAMIQSTEPDKSNETVFFDTFLPLVKLSEDTLRPAFDQFYQNEFKKLRKYTTTHTIVKDILEHLTNKGYRLALATNPLFPAPAVTERMKWAGIADYPWELITSYENSHFCKPNPNYYQEILNKLKLEPEECLMVGNDTGEDLSAAQLGIKTYLITDHLIDRGNSQWKENYRGTIKDFADFVKVL